MTADEVEGRELDVASKPTCPETLRFPYMSSGAIFSLSFLTRVKKSSSKGSEDNKLGPLDRTLLKGKEEKWLKYSTGQCAPS